MNWLVGVVVFFGSMGLSIAVCNLMERGIRLWKAGKAQTPPPSEELELETVHTWDLARSFLMQAGWDDYLIDTRRYSCLYGQPQNGGCYRFDDQGNVHVVRSSIQALETTLNGLLQQEPDLQALQARYQNVGRPPGGHGLDSISPLNNETQYRVGARLLPEARSNAFSFLKRRGAAR